MSNLGVPDAIGPIIGWRAWRVERIANVAILQSVVYDEVPWPPRRYLVATCPGEDESDHVVPEENCTCGIYAARDRPTLIDMRYGDYGPADIKVIGEVGLSGKVIVGQYGYRASKARPLRLYVPRMLWRLVADLEHYGVPIKLTNPFQ